MLLASESLQPIENPLLRMALLLVNGREVVRLARGRKGGKIVKAKTMLRDPTISVAAIAEMLWVSRATICSYLPEAHASAARALNAISPAASMATRVASMMFSARVNFVAWRMAALKDRFHSCSRRAGEYQLMAREPTYGQVRSRYKRPPRASPAAR
jgi:hypothetical protein